MTSSQPGFISLVIQSFVFSTLLSYWMLRLWLFVPVSPLLIDPETENLGSLRSGEARTVSFAVTNIGSSPIQVIGVNNKCFCKSVSKLPVNVNPGTTEPINVQFVAQPSKSRSVKINIPLVTNSPKCNLTLGIRYTLLGPHS
ncbi:DUF1573 domain-containing protein [Rubinisphaera margarita]|uniref:DUF1573 domain-containing protein n=1 Tax=Rubinisphaera margarita TaxID=2909586 RepID=UPI0036F2EEA3